MIRLSRVSSTILLAGAPPLLWLSLTWPPSATAWIARSLWAMLYLPVFLVAAIRFFNPRTSAMMMWIRARGEVRDPVGRNEAPYRWRDLSGISKSMWLAAIAGEDAYFAFHDGFDWESIRAAIEFNKTSREKRGASTITQQLAKNLFLWPGRSLLRKVIEAYLTLLLEGLCSKRRILELYLNLAQFDSRVFGVEAAARRFLRKPAAELTEQEAALLAAVLPNPEIYRADHPSHLVRFRQAMILANMKRLGEGYLAAL